MPNLWPRHSLTCPHVKRLPPHHLFLHAEEESEEDASLPDSRGRHAALWPAGACTAAWPPLPALMFKTQTQIPPCSLVAQVGQLVRNALGCSVTVLGVKAAAAGEPLRLWVRHPSGLEAPADHVEPCSAAEQLRRDIQARQQEAQALRAKW